MNISLFHNINSKLPLPGQLEGVANLIRSDAKLKVFTTSYRHTGSKTFKHEAPLFAVPVIFEGGKGRENVRLLTGLSLVDFDHVLREEGSVKNEESDSSESEEGRTKSEESDSSESNTPNYNTYEQAQSPNKNRLQQLKALAMADPHTVMCYTTISGEGLRIIFRYDVPEAMPRSTGNAAEVRKMETCYRQAFYAGNAYYERLLGLKADMQCKNITRLSGLAHDPDVFFRQPAEAVPFTAEEMDAAATAYARQTKEDKQLTRIQTFYDTLVAPSLAKAGIVFRSGSHNDYVMRVGYRLAEHRFARSAALKWAVARFGNDYPDTEQVVTSCFDNASPRARKGDTADADDCAKTASVDEIKVFLGGHVSLRLNEITSRVEYLEEGEEAAWIPINDRKVNSLWVEMSQTMRVHRQDVFNVIESDYVPVFNPFREYLDSLPPWHEGDHDYIADLAATVKVKGETYPGKHASTLPHLTFRTALQKWLVGMVAAWTSDEVVNNVILVLIGEQGSFKTTWFNYLLPPPLKQYFYTKTNANRMSKDDLLTLAQYALVCCEELDTMRPAELNQLKAAVTMQNIDERAAYAHFHEHRRHIASFCGTGNNTQFLSDPTGNRRWLPFEVESIVSPRDHPFPYEGIYAQTLALYRSGFRYWFSKEEIQQLNRHNRQFETPRLEQELVDLYFRRPQDGEIGTFMSVARALQIISNGISQKLSSTSTGRAFSDLGFKRVRTNSSRGFIVICRTADEMQAYQNRLSTDAQPDTPDE